VNNHSILDLTIHRNYAILWLRCIDKFRYIDMNGGDFYGYGENS
jgi:hypothetical protein